MTDTSFEVPDWAAQLDEKAWEIEGLKHALGGEHYGHEKFGALGYYHDSPGKPGRCTLCGWVWWQGGLAKWELDQLETCDEEDTTEEVDL